MHSPYSPSVKKGQGLPEKHTSLQVSSSVDANNTDHSLLTPPTSQPTTTTTTTFQNFTSSPLLLTFNQQSPKQKQTNSPNHPDYYNANLNKAQFNSILVNCTSNLLKILYTNHSISTNSSFNEKEIKLFIIEILKRSKTSIQSLQLTCFYIYKLINSFATTSEKQEPIKISVKNLFLGLIIISSKFNQDYNYSFKSWCKICGLKIDSPTKLKENIRILKDIEFYLLKILNFELFLNGEKYENWCNILFIFGFDFIKFQKLQSNLQSLENTTVSKEIKDGKDSIIEWDLDNFSNITKLNKWFKFFNNLKIENLNLIKISFESFYNSKIGEKIFYVNDVTNNEVISKKRCIDDNEHTYNNVGVFNRVKKIKV
ncbi:PCL5 [Candida pseudojiufengensis]|uniref:PCL5 n=1 Tax=Candida pseudojiufengensis TaxID=497109 RepID=UPI00222583AB|nr:PCL5 [Candida pseudojiufengensis]KAI5967804.1 PCL5 [Candida pseudojiufengensis]